MNTLKPCGYCGNNSFHYLPDMATRYGHISDVAGIRVKTGSANPWWRYTLVACTKCGNTLVFTADLEELARRVPGARVIPSDGG